MSNVVVHESAAALARTVAAALLDRLAAAQERGEVPHVGLTGGSVADALHHELGRQAADSTVDWSRVVFWWGDERFVDAGSGDRNSLQARRAFLDEVGIPPANVHAIPSSSDEPDAEQAALAYERDLRDHGAGEFEVLFLGVGPDGHVASLFPGRPALDVEDRIAVAVHDSPKPPPERVTLTFSALRRSRSVWFVATGEAKAEAVRAALTGGDPHEVPARGVQGREETVWHLDREAASLLHLP